MGNGASKAAAEAAEAQREVENMITTLENKLEAFELEVESKRGLTTENTKEVVGGRTVMRVSDIRVKNSQGVDSNIRGAVQDFFEAAANEIDGDNTGAKKSAVKGASNLISAGLDAIFGASEGQGKSKKSFVVLFMNNAFVRVDYYVYAFSASGKSWGAEASTSGACYLCDLAVLDITSLEPQEIDFLLTQALAVDNSEFEAINRLKFSLIQSSILGRALKNDDVQFEDLAKIAEALGKSTIAIDAAFGELKDIEARDDAFGDLRDIGAIANPSSFITPPSPSG